MKAHVEPTITIAKSELQNFLLQETNKAFQDGKSVMANICEIGVHDVFGAGKKRLKEYENAIDSLVEEYNVYVGDGVASDKIRQRLKQIGADKDD